MVPEQLHATFTRQSSRYGRALSLLCALLFSLCPTAPGAPAPEVSEAKLQLQELLEKIQEKLLAGQRTEKELKDEILRFDVLLLLHREEKTDDVAEILLAKAMLYFEVFNDTTRGIALLQQLKQDFPGTAPAKKVEGMIAATQAQGEAKKLQGNLVVGGVFPAFAEKDIAGRMRSLSDYRGKPVLISFWAGWSSGSKNEIGALLTAYEKYHPRGFEIIGVSLDRDLGDLTKFVRREGVPWPQLYDGKGWNNKLAMRYSVVKLPANYLLDGEGRIVGRNLRGKALESEIEKLLGRK